jgi:hypothetical protein
MLVAIRVRLTILKSREPEAGRYGIGAMLFLEVRAAVIGWLPNLCSMGLAIVIMEVGREERHSDMIPQTPPT